MTANESVKGMTEARMKHDNLSDRMLDFAARVLKMADSLPRTPGGRHISDQVIRSSTSGGAHYEEACGTESRKDFIHKLGISLKELRETRYWLRLIIRTELIPPPKIQNLHRESDELCRIIGKSILTAKINK